MASEAKEIADDIQDGDYMEAAGEAVAAYAAYNGYEKTAMAIQYMVDDDKNDGKPQESKSLECCSPAAGQPPPIGANLQW